MSAGTVKSLLGGKTGLVRPGWREVALLLVLAGSLVLVFAAARPLPQDPGYHVLADSRSVFGIPNFADVASNAAFLLVGLLGLYRCLTRRSGGASASWFAFFTGTAAVAAGSAYYHWAPGDATLAWDRLPMTIVVMSLFSALMAEHLRPAIERVVLPVSLTLGVTSVAWWLYADDLRLYGWVQFAPLLAIAFLLAAYPARYTHRSAIIWALAFYGLAKIAERFDQRIFELSSHAFSGHTLKHLLAALALFAVYRMVRVRGLASK